MLEYYLDDGGTHAGSPIVVWGGVAGGKDAIDKLVCNWKDCLTNPCEGKSPVRYFHSYELQRGTGEFDGYNQGARDLTRRNFRNAIIEAGATVLVHATPVRDWEQVVQKLGGVNLDAESAVLGQALNEVIKAAKDADMPINLQIDQGRIENNPNLLNVTNELSAVAHKSSVIANFYYSPVKDIPALQAADLVVHECYQFFCQYLYNKKASPGAHTRRLFSDAFFAKDHWMGRRQLKEAVKRMQKAKRRSRMAIA